MLRTPHRLLCFELINNKMSIAAAAAGLAYSRVFLEHSQCHFELNFVFIGLSLRARFSVNTLFAFVCYLRGKFSWALFVVFFFFTAQQTSTSDAGGLCSEHKNLHLQCTMYGKSSSRDEQTVNFKQSNFHCAKHTLFTINLLLVL